MSGKRWGGMTRVTATVREAARDLPDVRRPGDAQPNALSALARWGFAVRGITYCVIAWLALQIALGHNSAEASQRGALQIVARHTFGEVLLWVLGLGFAGYALWRLSEAAFGTAAEGRKTGPRLKSLVRGVVYASFAVSTFAFIAGHAQRSQSGQQATTTARLMSHAYGRWIVGIAGLVVIGVGIGMIVEGVRRSFEKQLRMEELHGRTRTAVVRLGMIGTAARGLVFAIAGGFVMAAAINENPSESKGLDGALRSLADTAGGPYLLGLVAAGLLAFGLFGLAMARYAKT